MIIPGKFDDEPGDDLLFYENTYFMDLVVVQPTNGTTTRTVTNSRVQCWVDDFNRAYATAGVRINSWRKVTADDEYLYAGYCSMPACAAGDSDCYNYSTVKNQIDKWIADNVPNSMVLVLENGGSSACSSSSVDFAWVGSSTRSDLANHEIGHYFHLPHAFNQTAHTALKRFFDCGTVDQAGAEEALGTAVTSLKSLDSDFAPGGGWQPVYDTPGDPGPYFFAAAGLDRCTASGQAATTVARYANGDVRYRTNVDAHNVMTYYLKPGFPNCNPSYDTRCGRDMLTEDQARVVRWVIRKKRSNLLK